MEERVVLVGEPRKAGGQKEVREMLHVFGSIPSFGNSLTSRTVGGSLHGLFSEKSSEFFSYNISSILAV